MKEREKGMVVMSSYSSLNVKWIDAWITRVTEAHGGRVSVNDSHEADGTVRSFGYDWGQALCRATVWRRTIRLACRTSLR